MNFQMNHGLREKKGEKLLAWAQLNMNFTFLSSTDDLYLFILFETHIWFCARNAKTDPDF